MATFKMRSLSWRLPHSKVLTRNPKPKFLHPTINACTDIDFPQFERPESAMKALIDLDGRFFGGRTVKAMFFPEERLDRQDLAPRPGQPD